MPHIPKTLITGGLLATLCALTACYRAPVVPPIGGAFTEISAPLDLNAEGNDRGDKVGRSASVCYLGLVALGDCSVDAAAVDGDIEQIKHIDYEFFNVLGVYQRFTTVVHGD